MNMTNTAMLVTFLTSLAAVPAASASLDTQTQNAVNTIGDGSNASGPVTHRRTVSSDGVTQTIETKDGTLTFQKGDGFSARFEAPMYVARVERDRSGTRRSYETPTMEYTVTKNISGVFTDCLSPGGRFRTVKTPDDRTRSFQGRNRSQVRERCELARATLRGEMHRIVKQALRLGILPPDIKIDSVNASKESVTIRSKVPVDVSMDGWQIEDAAGHSFELSGMIPGKGQITVMSGSAATNCTGRCWDRDVWNDAGDTAILRNANGKKVDVMATPG